MQRVMALATSVSESRVASVQCGSQALGCRCSGYKGDPQRSTRTRAPHGARTSCAAQGTLFPFRQRRPRSGSEEEWQLSLPSGQAMQRRRPANRQFRTPPWLCVADAWEERLHRCRHHRGVSRDPGWRAPSPRQSEGSEKRLAWSFELSFRACQVSRRNCATVEAALKASRACLVAAALGAVRPCPKPNSFRSSAKR